MGLFSNIPSSKKAKIVWDRVMGLSHELKCIIVSRQCVDFKQIDLGGLEYSLFMYDLECYRQVMTLNHSGFYIETTLRTIFLSMENNMKKVGNNIPENYLFNIFKELSNSLHHIHVLAQRNEENGLYAIAKHLCSTECRMTHEQINQNEDMVIAIAKHFEKIINLPIDSI